ncbi:MAG: type IV pili twitching motility protein PilT, partial [Candidatus Niyogibacteria bacterium]|nr:type IV pili twitching motility protein PilT [Candidatus Niyogibacteria bacterium]
MSAKDYFKEFEELIMIVAKEGASDLHISVGRHPTIRVSRELIPLVKKDVLTPETAQGLVYSILTDDQRAEFEKNRELDFSYNYEDKIRFRVNIFHQRGFVSA